MLLGRLAKDVVKAMSNKDSLIRPEFRCREVPKFTTFPTSLVRNFVLASNIYFVFKKATCPC